MKIIPALYIKHHRFALYQPGNPSYIEYLPHDPYELISSLAELNMPRIHIIDQDSWGDRPSPNTGLIGSLGNLCEHILEVGGGIRSIQSIQNLIHAGVNSFVIGSALFDNFAFLIKISKDAGFSNQQVLISIDMHDGKLATGRPEYDEQLSVRQLVQKCVDLGFTRFIINDINGFRIEDGPNVCFYRSLTEAFPQATFSASGRIITLEHVEALRGVSVIESMVGNEIYLIPGLLQQVAEFNLRQREQLGMA